MEAICKIEYFENKSQSIKEKFFASYEEAQIWAKENLENWNSDVIQTIH